MNSLQRLSVDWSTYIRLRIQILANRVNFPVVRIPMTGRIWIVANTQGVLFGRRREAESRQQQRGKRVRVHLCHRQEDVRGVMEMRRICA